MPRHNRVRHGGPRKQEGGGWIILALFAVIIAIIVFGLPAAERLDARNAASNQAALRSELGFEEGAAYPATIIGAREMQSGLSGDFFLASGEISGLDTVPVVIVSVTIDGSDYVLYVAFTDIRFNQVDGITEPTAAIDLRYAPSVSDDTTMNGVLKRYFKEMTITLSPEDFAELKESIP